VTSSRGRRLFRRTLRRILCRPAALGSACGRVDSRHTEPRVPVSVGHATLGFMVDSQPESLHHRTFRNRSLRESRFIGCDLSQVVIRGSDVGGMEVDSPWLLEGGAGLLVNGVDVVPLVDAELNRRFPGRGP